jgi:hypothetical protein
VSSRQTRAAPRGVMHAKSCPNDIALARTARSSRGRRPPVTLIVTPGARLLTGRAHGKGYWLHGWPQIGASSNSSSWFVHRLATAAYVLLHDSCRAVNCNVQHRVGWPCIGLRTTGTHAVLNCKAGHHQHLHWQLFGACTPPRSANPGKGLQHL